MHTYPRGRHRCKEVTGLVFAHVFGGDLRLASRYFVWVGLFCPYCETGDPTSLPNLHRYYYESRPHLFCNDSHLIVYLSPSSWVTERASLPLFFYGYSISGVFCGGTQLTSIASVLFRNTPYKSEASDTMSLCISSLIWKMASVEQKVLFTAVFSAVAYLHQLAAHNPKRGEEP